MDFHVLSKTNLHTFSLFSSSVSLCPLLDTLHIMFATALFVCYYAEYATVLFLSLSSFHETWYVVCFIFTLNPFRMDIMNSYQTIPFQSNSVRRFKTLRRVVF